MNWLKNKHWSDKFLDEIKQILGRILIAAAPYMEDRDHNTDLIVMTLQPYRVGCRVRRFEYLQRYPNDFTIRSNVPSGLPSELAKIIEGWADYFFYGFSNEDESGLADWFLGDLNVFRLWFNRQLVKNKGKAPGTLQDNYDGSSSFRAFDRRQMPYDFVVANGREEEVVPMC